MELHADRILIFDPDDTSRHALASALRKAGFAVDAEPDWSSNLARVRSVRLDLILLSAEDDGATLPTAVRSLKALDRQVPVVAMVRRECIRICRDSLRAGAADYLVMPEASADLVKRIRTLLREQREWSRADQARRVAEKAESLQTLAGGIAHDLNNQLTVILGSVEELETFFDSPEEREECLSAIRRSGRVIAGLAEKLLAYSGGGLFEVEVRDLREVLPEQIQDLVWRLLSGMGRSTSVRVSAGPSPLPAAVDLNQLSKVMEGVLCNALESIHEATGEVRVQIDSVAAPSTDGPATSPSARATDSEYARIRVIDTGIGMDTATLGRIFEPFFSTKSTGRGLGLAGALGVMRAHGGSIQVESHPGRGTQVTCLLPLYREKSARRAPHAVPAPPPAPAGFQTRCTGRVLIIDDEHDVRRMAARILARIGLEIGECDNGEAGIRMYESSTPPYDLVVLDLTMPGMDGVETLRRLRQINPRTQVILVSGYHPREVTSRFTDERPNAFVQKPFEIAELVQTVTAVLSLASDPRTVGAPADS